MIVTVVPSAPTVAEVIVTDAVLTTNERIGLYEDAFEFASTFFARQ